MSEGLVAALKETERAIKKQKLCALQSVAAVDAVQLYIETARKQVTQAQFLLTQAHMRYLKSG
jgi:hypothetical protein